MRLLMKTWIPISIMLVILGTRAFGQALPTATEAVTPSPSGTGPRVSWVDGTVHYALTASEVVQHGYYGSGVTSSAALSGNAGWVSMSQVHPSTLLFAG